MPLGNGKGLHHRYLELHSHLTHDPDHKAVAWLMHFKFANSKDNVKDVIRHQDVWGWKKVLWRCTKQQKYRHGTHDV